MERKRVDVKTELIDGALINLFEADSRRLGETLKSIEADNMVFYGSTVGGFIFKNSYFCSHSFSGSRNKVTLRPELYDRMESFLKDRELVRKDYDMIRQFILKMMPPPQLLTLQSIRDVIPDVMIPFAHESIRNLARQRDFDDVLKATDPRTQKQFRTSLLPKIEMYAATRLLY